MDMVSVPRATSSSWLNLELLVEDYLGVIVLRSVDCGLPCGTAVWDRVGTY